MTPRSRKTSSRKSGESYSSDDRRVSVFQPEFREDLAYWIKHDHKVALRAMAIVEEVMKDPFRGIGKPEPLKYLGADVWSRRLTEEHRVVYLIRAGRIDFLQARYHY